MSTRVVIADGEELVRSGFRMILESEADIDVVDEAADGRAAIELSERERPDVVLMDIRLPGLDGVEVTRQLCQLGTEPRARVLIVTASGDDECFYAALRAGARGFILRDTPPEELVRAVRVVAKGECLLAPELTRRLIDQLANRPFAAPAPARLKNLTERELEVLRLIAHGLSNSQIADELVVRKTTVKTHVGHLFAKLAVGERAQAVVVAYESGLVRAGPAANGSR